MSEVSDVPFRVRVIELGFCEPDTRTCPVIEGPIDLVIAGAQLLDAEEREIGINRTALQLARTLSEDHVARDDDGYLVSHACGTLILVGGCTNFGVEWDVAYTGDLVTISDVVVHSADAALDRSGLTITMSAADYRAEIAAFCREVLAFAEAHPRDHHGDAVDEEDWRLWQAEVRDRLAGGTTRFAFSDGAPDLPTHPGLRTRVLARFRTRT